MADEYLATAATKPSLLLKGEKPKRIDEWQDALVAWDAVRTAVDNSNGISGQYILTGSNAVYKTKIGHTGTGRITRMKMYSMSLWESLESSGEVSILDLFDNPEYDFYDLYRHAVSDRSEAVVGRDREGIPINDW